MNRWTIAICSLIASLMTDDAQAQQHDAEALLLLDRVVERYQTAPALTDHVKAKMTTPLGGLEFEFEIALGANGTSRTQLRRDTTFTIIDQSMYMTRRYAANRYARASVQPNLIDGLASVMGGRHSVPIHFYLRSGQTPESCLERLTLRALQGATFDRVDEIKKDDRTLSRITISASNGSSTLTVDPETLLLVSYELFGSASVGGPEAEPVSALFEYSPTVLEKLPEPIAFEAGDRRQVRNLASLIPEAGDLAPPVELDTLNGTTVNTAELDDTIVILEFWSSWSGPCKVGLPLTNEYVQSLPADTNVRVFAVNVMENGMKDDIAAMAKRYWDRAKFAFPTLLDVTATTVRDYAAQPPTTIVIGLDGRIAERFDRHRDDKVEHLQHVVGQIQEGG